MPVKPHIANLSVANWGGSSPSGSFTFYYDGGSITHQLDKEDCEKIFAIGYEIVHRKKMEISDAISKLETPPLLGYDRTKTIEASDASEDIQPPAPTPPAAMDDEIPF